MLQVNKDLGLPFGLFETVYQKYNVFLAFLDLKENSIILGLFLHTFNITYNIFKSYKIIDISWQIWPLLKLLNNKICSFLFFWALATPFEPATKSLSTKKTFF
jgi:hypothetical protein